MVSKKGGGGRKQVRSELYLFAASFIEGTDECVQLLDGYRHSDGVGGKAGRGWWLYAVEMKVGYFFWSRAMVDWVEGHKEESQKED